MTYRQEEGGVIWVDLERPTPDEIRAVANEFELSTRIEEELFSPTPLPMVLTEPHAAFLALHFPTRAENDLLEQEVDFIVGKHFVLTVRYDIIASFHELRRLLDAGEALGKKRVDADALLELLFNHLYDGLRAQAADAAKRLAKIEREMISGKERSTIRAVSAVSREFLHLEAAAANHEESLMLFLDELTNKGFFGAHFSTRVARVSANRAQVARLLGTHRSIATEVREMNDALLSSTQNEIMKTLTIMAFVTFPLTLIAGIFSMDTLHTPIVGSAYDFWIVLGMMVALTLGFFGYFRIKHWL